jgi:hypothetical protein
MERSFRHDFSTVRVHQGRTAADLGALAFTSGNDIHFAPGQYDPHGTRGQELLGHELAHVVQQSSGRVRPTLQAKGTAINDDASLEREADEAGVRAARDEPAGIAGGGTATSTVVQGKNLKQANLAAGFKSIGKRRLVGNDKRKVTHYRVAISCPGNRAAALQAIAEFVGKHAQSVDSYAQYQLGIPISNDKWTTEDELLNSADLQKIDPYVLTVLATYRSRYGEHTLKAVYQQSK